MHKPPIHWYGLVNIFLNQLKYHLLWGKATNLDFWLSDLERLYSVSAVTWSKNRTIRRRVAAIYKIWGPSHFDFHDMWISIKCYLRIPRMHQRAKWRETNYLRRIYLLSLCPMWAQSAVLDLTENGLHNFTIIACVGKVKPADDQMRTDTQYRLLFNQLASLCSPSTHSQRNLLATFWCTTYYCVSVS